LYNTMHMAPSKPPSYKHNTRKSSKGNKEAQQKQSPASNGWGTNKKGAQQTHACPARQPREHIAGPAREHNASPAKPTREHNTGPARETR
jgi:hypothetical protein